MDLDLFTKRRKCFRCAKVTGTVPLRDHINGLCLACWKEKPRVSLEPGTYRYRNVDGKQVQLTITLRS